MATQNNLNNTSNTFSASSINIDSNAAGDAYLLFKINTTDEFVVGIDDSDSDAFVIAQGGALGTNNTMKSTSAGEVLFPLQPAFLAQANTATTNITGAGATYTQGTTALTEIFDQGGDFNTNGTFTAPVTGVYSLDSSFHCSDLTNPTPLALLAQIVTSNRTYQCVRNIPETVSNGGALTLSSYADMDSADTSTTTVTVTGMAGNTGDLAISGPINSFSGYLTC